MSTSAQILAAWKAAIFDHADVLAETRNAFDHDVLADVASISEDSRLRYAERINFITYITARETQTGSLRGNSGAVTRYTHTIEVDYHLIKSSADASQNYNEAIRVIELIDDLVRSQLGKDWDGTVDYYEFKELRRPQLIDIDGKKVWKVGHTYVGTKTV